MKNFFRIKNRAPKLRIFGKAILYFMENDLPTTAAAISYFTMLMLFPLLIVLLSLGGTIFGHRLVIRQMIQTVLTLLPGTSEFVRLNVESAMHNLSNDIVISAGIIVFWASLWIFSVIEKALNRIWHTSSRAFLRGRLLNLGMSMGLGILLIVSATVTTVVAVIRSRAARLPVNLPSFVYVLTGYAWQLTFSVVSLVITITIFTVIYRFMPNAKVTVNECLPGAILSGVLWEIAKYGFALVIPYFHYNLFYGPIGLGVALLTWIYISSIVMLFGAQLTALFHVERIYDEKKDAKSDDKSTKTLQPADTAPLTEN